MMRIVSTGIQNPFWENKFDNNSGRLNLSIHSSLAADKFEKMAFKGDDSDFKNEIGYKVINDLINSDQIKVEYKQVLKHYKNNDSFKRIVFESSDLIDFLDQTIKREKLAKQDLSTEFLKAKVFPTSESWIIGISMPGRLLEIDLPKAGYEVYYGKNKMDEAYCDRTRIIGDEKLASFWLKTIGVNPDKMSDKEIVDRIVSIGHNKREIALIEKKTMELAQTNPEDIGFIKQKMEKYFQNVIKRQEL